MPDLVSPGVSVTVTNESMYANAPTGTVPLIVIATAQDKLQPGSTSIAQGTTKATAGELKLITSQRDALQTYGSPIFYNVGGTPQYDNELNEMGLFSLYEFLGIANNAYVIRADIDLRQLIPSSTAPTGSPTSGSYWLDISQSTWGAFRSDGNVNPAFAWQAKNPYVLNSATQLQNIVQGYPATKITSANANVLVSSGTLVINGTSVPLTNTQAITGIVDSINASKPLQLMQISAEVFSRNETQGGGNNSVVSVYNLRIISANITTTIDLTGSDTSVLTALGFAAQPVNIAVPIDTLGVPGDLAVDTLSSESDGSYKNRMYEKVSVVTGTGLSSVTKSWWFIVGTNDQSYIDGTPANTVFKGWGWQASELTSVLGSVNSPTFNTEATAQIKVGNSAVFTVGTDGTTLTSLVANINATFATASINANADVYTSGITSTLRITNYDGTDIWLHDTTNVNPVWSTAGVDTSQTYFATVTGNIAVPVFNQADSFSVDIGGGPKVITVLAIPSNDISNVVVQINTAVGATIATQTSGILNLNRAGTYITLKELVGSPLTSCGIDVGYTYGRTAFFQDYYPALAVPSKERQLTANSIWINTTSQNRGTNTIVKRYVNGTWVVQNSTPNTGTIPWFKDTTSADVSFGARKSVGSIFAHYNADAATPTEINMQLLRWDGSAWIQLDYTPGATAPQGAPVDGTLWYNTQLQADIMVNDGHQWLGYKNLYPATDPNGVLISGSAPVAQSNGNALVDYDIWLDSSATAYPVLNRYVSSSATWVQIDNTDHQTPGGIIFEDARSTAGSSYQYSTLTSVMVQSNWVDSDVPNAELYPAGMLLFNTRYSTNNVKQWNENYFGLGMGTWVTASGNNPSDFTPYMGKAAQRIMVVEAMQGALQSNQDARAEATYFNLIATPGYPECIDEMVNLNVDKKQIAFVVGDTPAHLPANGTDFVNWATNAASAYDNGDAGLVTHDDYAAVWYPWGLSTNLDGSYVFVPPSMMALRTIAFNDQVAYPWFAPAGYNRGLVTSVNSVGYLNSIGEYKPVSLNQGQRDVLYSNSINPIAYIPNRGLVIYGQKTLSPTTSALDRINVARLVNYLKYQLDNVAKAYLFEPNDKQTRDAVLTTFNAFFNNLVGLRAIYDFAVVCDESNNTPARIDANQLWIDVAIKPEKAIEFIYIPIRLLNTGDPLPNGTRG